MEHKRHSNAICEICGKGYYKRPSDIAHCCSVECKQKYFYNKGQFRLIPYCESKGITPNQLMQQIDKMHNVEMKTLKAVSEELNITRITIIRLCKKYGVKTRTISEDNTRRYSCMSESEIKAQTEKAHEKIRELFKNPEWKSEQINKVLKAQDYKISAPERLFEKLMNENGYFPISQYGKGMGGFIIDFAFPDIKLAIEIDGEYWHSLPRTIKRDKRKNYFLKNKKGWELIRIPALDFTKNATYYIWEVIQTIETLKVA